MSGTGDLEASRLERQQLLVALNHKIREGLVDPFAAADEQRCDFVCECGDVDCRERLLLPSALFDDLKENDVALFADGHPVSLARQARIAARDLKAAAQALQAQGRLQVERAQRLRGTPEVIAVRVSSVFAGSDLAWAIDEPAEISDGPRGVEVTVEVTTTLVNTLSHVRDWANRYGLETVDVTIAGETKTLIV